MVRKHTLYDLISLKFIQICFTASHVVCPGECVLEMMVCLPGLDGVLDISLLGSVLVYQVQVFHLLVIFCLVALYVTESVALFSCFVKLSISILYLSILPYILFLSYLHCLMRISEDESHNYAFLTCSLKFENHSSS